MMAETRSMFVASNACSTPHWVVQLRKEIMQTDKPFTGHLGSSYCGTTRELHVKYISEYDPHQVGQEYRIDEKRVEEVCIYQQIYKRRFWSQKTLIRLIQEVIVTLYCYLLDGGALELVSADQFKTLVDTLMPLQTNHNGQWWLPVLRPVPRATVSSKVRWMLDRMIVDRSNGVWFVQRDNTNPNEFLQYYMNFVKKVSNFPKCWFSWHNVLFPEYYEYPAHADREDLGDYTLILEH